MTKQFSGKPIRKVSAGALAGAGTTLFIWLVKSAWSVDVPAEVASALTVILTFGVSYQVPASDQDLITAETEIERAA